MKQRTITVKGTGQASLPPDYIEIPLYLESRDEQYDQAIELASQKLEELQHCLEEIGFKKEDLKVLKYVKNYSYKEKNNKNNTFNFLLNNRQKTKIHIQCIYGDLNEKH